MKLRDRAAIITGASRGSGRSTALSLAAQGCPVLINFNRSKDEAEAVAPGFIVSRWTEDGLKENFEAVRDAHIERSALHQVLGPDDVAEAVLSLLEGSDLITGQTLVIDGGAMIGQ